MSRARTTTVNMVWLLPDSQRVPSPNFSKGRAGVPVDVLALHYAVDGDDFERGENETTPFTSTSPSVDVHDVARLFSRQKRGASAHFAVGRDSSVAQMVELDDTSWATGGGAFPDAGPGPLEKPVPWRMNRRSISVEMCNAGWAVDKLGIPHKWRAMATHPATPRRRREWEVYRPLQVEALHYLVVLLRGHFDLSRPTYVLGHEDVVNRDTLGKQYGGKVDPGPLFPWSAIPWRRYGYVPVRYDFEQKAWVEREEAA